MHPLGALPLARAIVPGDQIVLALQPYLPQTPEVIAGIMQYLAEQGVEASQVTILHAADSSMSPADLLAELPSGGSTQPRLLLHDPTDRSQLAYLAADDAGLPLYLNRVLCDADVVLPVGWQRVLPASHKPNINRAVFPLFSGSPPKPRTTTRGRKRRRPAIEVAGEPEILWLLGVQFCMQVVPGPAGSIRQVVAGGPQAVFETSQQLCAKAWQFTLPRRASLVVATIEGDRTQQTWRNLGNALAAAASVVAEGGAIAICCELEAAPGAAVAQLALAEDREAARQRARKQRLSDAKVVSQLLQAQNQARVYLLSRLDEELVEQLGMAYVAEAGEIARLAQRHASFIAISNAQYARATAIED